MTIPYKKFIDKLKTLAKVRPDAKGTISTKRMTFSPAKHSGSGGITTSRRINIRITAPNDGEYKTIGDFRLTRTSGTKDGVIEYLDVGEGREFFTHVNANMREIVIDTIRELKNQKVNLYFIRGFDMEKGSRTNNISLEAMQRAFSSFKRPAVVYFIIEASPSNKQEALIRWYRKLGFNIVEDRYGIQTLE